jgi:hypothetical protein
MNSYSCPTSLPTVLSKHESSTATNLRQANAIQVWPMLKQLGWLAAVAVIALIIWQIAAAEPLLPRAASAALLMVISLAAGLRIGVDSAAAYIEDVQRTNKVLAEQHHDLAAMNELLLRKVNSGQSRTESHASESG